MVVWLTLLVTRLSRCIEDSITSGVIIILPEAITEIKVKHFPNLTVGGMGPVQDQPIF